MRKFIKIIFGIKDDDLDNIQAHQSEAEPKRGKKSYEVKSYEPKDTEVKINYKRKGSGD